MLRKPKTPIRVEESSESSDFQDIPLDEQRRRTSARAQLEEQRNPSRKCMHRFFNMIALMTGVCGFLMGLGQIIGMTYEDLDMISYVLRAYILVLCGLVALIEAEWTSFIINSSILRVWVTRGLFYAFIGVIGIQQNENVIDRDHNQRILNKSPSLQFIRVMAWIMVGCGILYFGMGVACLQIYYNRLRKDYEERCGRAVHIRRATALLAEAEGAV
mmetsp:Transcript_12559/g.24108  ORF Transcript_12559/g.24108 Transcript_12559/m.24108 type:complete len:216 (-) Transcript_12559:89-736(-)